MSYANEAKIPNFELEAQVKLTGRQKQLLDEIRECLEAVFDCRLTSPKMYSEDKDVFYQYLLVKRRTES